MWARSSGSTVRPAGLRCLTACAEMGGIPVNHDGGEQVEAGHAVVLALAGAVADFALAPDAEGVLEGMDIARAKGEIARQAAQAV